MKVEEKVKFTSSAITLDLIVTWFIFQFMKSCTKYDLDLEQFAQGQNFGNTN